MKYEVRKQITTRIAIGQNEREWQRESTESAMSECRSTSNKMGNGEIEKRKHD